MTSFVKTVQTDPATTNNLVSSLSCTTSTNSGNTADMFPFVYPPSDCRTYHDSKSTSGTTCGATKPTVARICHCSVSATGPTTGETPSPQPTGLPTQQPSAAPVPSPSPQPSSVPWPHPSPVPTLRRATCGDKDGVGPMAESVTDDECGKSERWVYNLANAASSCESTECSMDNPVDKVRNSYSPNAYD